jgi:hypothetical protein
LLGTRGYELWELDTWELGIKGLAAVSSEAETRERVGCEFTVVTGCGNMKKDGDGFPSELFGVAWRPEVTGQPERATGLPDGVRVIGREMGTDVGGGFEEDPGSEADNTGWWPTPAEVPLFERRHGFPGSGVQVPAATTELAGGVVAFAIFYRATRHQRQRNMRQKVRPVCRRRNP